MFEIFFSLFTLALSFGSLFCAFEFHGVGLVMTTFIYFEVFGTVIQTQKVLIKHMLCVCERAYTRKCVCVVEKKNFDFRFNVERKKKVFVFGITSGLEK